MYRFSNSPVKIQKYSSLVSAFLLVALKYLVVILFIQLHKKKKQIKSGNMRRFYKQFNLKKYESKELRLRRSQILKKENPQMVPLVIQGFGDPNDQLLMQFSNFNTSISKKKLVSSVVEMIKSRLELKPTDNFDICTGKGWYNDPTMTIGTLYKLNREDDGMLYIAFARQKFYTNENPYTPLFGDDED